MAPVYLEEELFMLIPALLSSVPSAIFGIAAYVLSSLAIYTIARRRGLNHPWLAWVPMLNCWILGSLSDQYQYIVKGQNKSKRKILLVLSILTMAFSLTILVLAVVMVVSALAAYAESELLGLVLAVLGICLPLIASSIAYTVIRYMALYDVYRSLDPGNAVLFLVLSIFFGITEPFFLFFNRNKDDGMPPRKQPQPAYIPAQEPEPQPEPWDQESKDYL